MSALVAGERSDRVTCRCSVKGRVFKVARRLYNEVLQDSPANLQCTHLIKNLSIRLIVCTLIIFACLQYFCPASPRAVSEGTKKAAAPKDKSLPLDSRSSPQRPRAHTCELAQVDERPYRALPFTAAFSPSSTAVTAAAASFVKVTEKNPDVLPGLSRRCFQEGDGCGRPSPACVIRDCCGGGVALAAFSIPVRALLWFFRSISPQRARPICRLCRDADEHAGARTAHLLM